MLCPAHATHSEHPLVGWEVDGDHVGKEGGHTMCHELRRNVVVWIVACNSGNMRKSADELCCAWKDEIGLLF